MFPVCSRQMQEVGAVLGQQRLGGEVRAEATRRKDDRAMFLEIDTTFLIDETNAGVPVHEKLAGARLRDDPRLVGLLRYLLHHLDQSIRDGHAREALLATVRTGCRVAAETGHQGEVEVEPLNQPVDICATVAAENLNHLGLLSAALQGVRGEELDGVIDARCLLSLGGRTVNAARRFSRVPPAEGGLVHQDHLSSVLQDCVSRGHARQATAYDDGLVRREYQRHCAKENAIGSPA
mmetsp:Transcript_84961/g.182118  ORF Transcript_84961/g.182118 Transcript_84961/m.182118 type:complete len:236 (-) Transcript_84961:44-751(-)